MITSSIWAGQRYAVLGLARSGLATVRALAAAGAHVVAWDASPEARERAGGVDGVIVHDPAKLDLTGAAGLVVSPGVPLNTHPLVAQARAAGVPVIGDIELFAQARGELPPHKVVGITGTNGKSTTTALVHHILKTAGVPTLMGGNIGLPILAQEPLPEGGVYVLELSSYQIDLTQTLDCDVAVLLNITPDHLDRYGGFDAYAASKARLFEMQSPGGSAVIVGQDKASREIAELCKPRSIQTTIGAWRDEGVSLCDDTEVRFLRRNKLVPNTLIIDGSDIYGAQAEFPALQGPHNAVNLVAGMAACYALLTKFGIPQADQAWLDALRTFPGLPHRMERVATLDGVTYVDDSKATNPESTAPALQAYPRVHWIVGGRAKGDELDACAPGFPHVVRAYTIGEAGGRFAAVLDGKVPVEEAGTLEEAVRRAAANAARGEAVLLSPAAASFDQFRDYEHRGQAFREAVAALKPDFSFPAQAGIQSGDDDEERRGSSPAASQLDPGLRRGGAWAEVDRTDDEGEGA